MSSECPNAPYASDICRPKCFNYFCEIEILGNITAVWYMNYRLDVAQNLCEFWQLFLSDFLSPKCPNIARPKYVPGGKMS